MTPKLTEDQHLLIGNILSAILENGKPFPIGSMKTPTMLITADCVKKIEAILLQLYPWEREEENPI